MNRIPWSELELDEDCRECHRGEPFTGIAFENDVDGRLIAEAAFVEGVLHGRKTTWYASGTVESDGHYCNNVTHGERREWAEDGRLRTWVRAEHGIPLETKDWDASGALIQHFVLNETDPLWNVLLRVRKNRPTA